ncbi:flagellar hook-length control protein FliK [Clostridium akagii]|uniref:flagellar hook-length control protein FliK n=1 Tax=Clostridium akagii TaxID=91623 RepID=UPI00047CE127|nr:flagellar hook-length control protein FliK [Clostridium akagii]
MSEISINNNVKFLDSVGTAGSVSKSVNNSDASVDNNTNFKNVLQSKTQNSENTKTTGSASKNDGASNTNKDVNKNQTVDTTSKTDEEKLQDIEKEINDITDGTKSVNNNDLAALIASLQQILNSLLKNTSATQSNQNASGNLDVNLISKLTDLKDNLAKYAELLSSSKNVNGTQELTDLVSKLDLGKTDLSNSAVATQTNITDNNADVSSTTVNDKVAGNDSSDSKVTVNNPNDNNIFDKIKTELTDLMKDIKSSQSNSSSIAVSSKLKNIEQILTVTNKAIDTVKLTDTNKLTDVTESNNTTKVDFNTTAGSSSLSPDSSESGSENTYGNNTSNKDNDFLNKLIDNKQSSSDQYSKVTGVINQILNNNNISSSSEIKNPVPTARSSNFAEDIITNLKYMDNNNIKDLTVTIAPKGLGTVMINITTENGVMKASITATNKEAYNLLNANVDQINSSINSQEIKVSNVNINIYNGDTTYFKDGSNSGDAANQKQGDGKTTNGVGVIEDQDIDELNSIYENDNVNALV